MFQRILVPLDGSPQAERALPVATRLAQASGGSITLLRVVTHPHDAALSFLQPPQEGEREIEAAHSQAVDYLEEIAHSSTLAGIESVLQVADSIPAQTILSTAHLGQVDSIVMCSHSDAGFKRWALGSVAQTVARHSPVPVLILRGEADAPALLQLEAPRPLRVLVPLDGSVFAEAALFPAAVLSAALSAPAPGALHLTLVLIGENTHNAKVGEYIEANMQEALAYLETVERRLRTGDTAKLPLEISSSVAIGMDVADTLMNIAEENPGEGEGLSVRGFDLIALTTHGRHGADLWIMGSVTERILEVSRLPLLIVRPSTLPGEDG